MIKNYHTEVKLSLNLASLTDAKRPAKFTELKPDDNSSALRISKEQLGRFSWY